MKREPAIQLEELTIHLAEAMARNAMLEAENQQLRQKGPATESADGRPEETAPYAQTVGLAAENKQLRQYIKYYENPYNHSSQNSIPTRQKKAAAAKASGEVPASTKAKPGRKQGREEVSHTRKPTQSEGHRPKSATGAAAPA